MSRQFGAARSVLHFPLQRGGTRFSISSDRILILPCKSVIKRAFIGGLSF
ncbi:hypothetical protein HMPREF7215_1847 [Pyramidobacter piscolens W5455]|uniref:DUF4236 domain-containing protein n=1 Tax=Pyramidobacter piscolens W5455 TaxID=352165 RepID=A0ABM9ZV33_9BACT|nr:hypothetical protein HMPREF7215_1847 [Pyramidobacter piscolens W5455]